MTKLRLFFSGQSFNMNLRITKFMKIYKLSDIIGWIPRIFRLFEISFILFVRILHLIELVPSFKNILVFLNILEYFWIKSIFSRFFANYEKRQNPVAVHTSKDASLNSASFYIGLPIARDCAWAPPKDWCSKFANFRQILKYFLSESDYCGR